MATNEPMEAPMNEFVEFDRVAIQIMDTFESLIRQLIERRDALLRELQEMKDKYFTKESNRKSAREELLATQQLLKEANLKVNENKECHQQATDIYKERIQQLETPIKLPLPFLSCSTLNELTTAITEFGEVKECKLDYSLKKQPVLAVAKEETIVFSGYNRLNYAACQALPYTADPMTHAITSTTVEPGGYRYLNMYNSTMTPKQTLQNVTSFNTTDDHLNHAFTSPMFSSGPSNRYCGSSSYNSVCNPEMEPAKLCTLPCSESSSSWKPGEPLRISTVHDPSNNSSIDSTTNYPLSNYSNP